MNFFNRLFAAVSTRHGVSGRVAGVHSVKKHFVDFEGNRVTGIMRAVDPVPGRGVTQSLRFGFGQPL